MLADGESNPYWMWDALRFTVGVCALWLAFLVARLGWHRRHDRATSAKPHWLTYASFAGALLLIGALRIGHIGDPPSWDLFPAIVVVAAGLVGVLARVRLPHRAPHRR